jgi:diaminopimelate epimerase
VIFPKEIEIFIENNFNEKENIKGSFVNVGTDHFVIEKENIKNINVEKLGKIIRNDINFLPNGTNVNFFEKANEANTIFLRTYEKGVEKETGACGTGAISTALVYFKKYGYSGELKIFPTSNSVLFVDLILRNSGNSGDNLQSDLYNAIEKIILTGSVDLIFV